MTDLVLDASNIVSGRHPHRLCALRRGRDVTCECGHTLDLHDDRAVTACLGVSRGPRNYGSQRDCWCQGFTTVGAQHRGSDGGTPTTTNGN